MSQMLKSSGAMAAATLASRILGLAREMVYAWFMGAGMVAGAFLLAFQIPNLFRRLLGEGALTASFIPIFKEKERTSTREEMWRAANAVISGLIVVAGVLCIIVMLGVTIALAIGEGRFEEKTELMLRLLRFMFPYMLLICLTAIFMGMLNARGHFFVPASGAIVMNAVMIASVFLLAPRMGATLNQQVFALAIGVLVAGAAQAAMQLPWLRADGFRYRWVSPWKDDTVRRVARQMIPGTIGVAAFQINMLVTQSVAFWVDPSVVAWFTNSVRLMELPQGMFGVSLATFLLPTLAGLAAEKKRAEFRDTLGQGVGHLVFANLPASIFLCVLAAPIIRLLFEHGKYGPTDTMEASRALMCLAPGLIAFSLVNIFARAFYAMGDIKTPMKISIICLAINLVLSLALIWPYRQAGMGIANTITGIVNACLLYFALRRKMDGFHLAPFKRIGFQLFVAGAISGLAAWGISVWWQQTVGHAGTWRRLGDVFVPMIVAGSLYWMTALWLKVPPAVEIWNLLRQKLAGNAG